MPSRTTIDTVYDVNGTSHNSFYKTQLWDRQNAPWVKPLPYELRSSRCTGAFNSPFGGSAGNTLADSFTTGSISGPGLQILESCRSSAQHRLYQKFKEAIHSDVEAQAGETAAEYGSTGGMVKRRWDQVQKADKYAREGNANMFFRTLGMRQLSKNLPKEIADTWLEFNFGWRPVIQSLYDAAAVFQRPWPSGRVSAAAGSSSSYLPDSHPVVAHAPKASVYFRVRYKAGALVVFSNPTLHLLDQMGVTNPALLAWNLMPYSWVVDQFIGIGEFLSTLTDFMGVEIYDPYTTECVFANSVEAVWKSGGEFHPSFGCQSFSLSRKLTMPSAPPLRSKLPTSWPGLLANLGAVGVQYFTGRR